MKKVVKKLDSLTEAFDNNLYYNREDLLNRGAYSEGKAEGIAEGIAEGESNKQLSIIKEMLAKDFADETIMEICRISSEELINIKNQLKSN